MTWLQTLAQAGVMATFSGVGIAVATYVRGRHIKEGVSKLGEILAGITKTLDGIERTPVQMETKGINPAPRRVRQHCAQEVEDETCA